MHLITPLVAGIRGAEIGSIELLERGTSTHAVYYKDFEASQQYSAQPIPLDSFGSVTLYVDRLVDVLVHDANGVLVREFVAGVEDSAVEVISPSFTGVDYRSGEIAVQKPTDLGRVLDLWTTNAGAPDWKVSVGGVPTTLSAALANVASPFLNVKTFGAQGNGVNDDRSAIVSAINAALAVGGGIVFFPPGVYRMTSGFTLPGNIGLLGGSGKSTMLALDVGPSTNFVTLGANGAGALSWVHGIWIGLMNQGGGHALISAASGSSGEFHFIECVIGAVSFNYAFGYRGDTTSSALKVVFDRCYCRTSAPSTAPPFFQTGAGVLTLRDCEITTDATSATTLVTVETNTTIVGCRLSAPNTGTAQTTYIRLTDSTQPNPIIVNSNYFAPCFASTTSVALRNDRTSPSIGWLESGNVFGSMTAANPGLIPYAFFTDGFPPGAGALLHAYANGSRTGRLEAFVVSPTVAVTVNPKAFGMTVIAVSAGGGATVTLNANKGNMGDRWLLNVINNTGGAAISVVAGANIQWPGSLFNVNPGLSLVMELTWTSTVNPGNWVMTGKEQLI